MGGGEIGEEQVEEMCEPMFPMGLLKEALAAGTEEQ